LKLIRTLIQFSSLKMQEKEFLKTKVGEAILKKVQEDKNFKPTVFEV